MAEAGRADTRSGFSVSSLTDAGLLEGVTKGQEPALAEIYERYGTCTFASVARLVGSRQAEVITGEVFLALWNAPPEIHARPDSLQSQLLSDARRRAVERRRADPARRTCETRLPVDELVQQLLNHWVSEGLDDGLSVLSEVERRSVVLASFGGYTYREVAGLLDQPERTVAAAIRAGLERLQDRTSA